MPMLPPAPPRFSTMKDLPVDCSSAAVTMRAVMSDGPPGVFATTKRTGRSGEAASAERVRRMAGIATPAASAPLITRRRDHFGWLIVVSPWRVSWVGAGLKPPVHPKLGQKLTIVQGPACDTSARRAVDARHRP